MIRTVFSLAALLLVLGACSGPQQLLGSRPMQFTCLNLEPHIARYDHRLFSDLQRDAVDPDIMDAIEPANIDVQMAFYHALAPRKGYQGKLLLLSGGGQWGAFGAGFLSSGIPNPDDDDNPFPREQQWNAITGISTGAIQVLFAGADDLDEMARQYRLPNENPASSNGLFGLLSKGSEHDLTNLRRLLQNELYGSKGSDLLAGIVKNPKRPELFIAMVEGRSTDLIIVHLSGYIRENLSSDGTDGELTRTEVGDCVTGLTLASSAIPLRLTPIQIDIAQGKHPTGDFRTFMDGGVRSSVIDQQVIDFMEASYTAAMCRAVGFDGSTRELTCTREKLGAIDDQTRLETYRAPLLYVVRNGPTIVPAGSLDTEIDDDPDAYVTAMRGYSALVNQNELASVAEMQARYPFSELRFVSADGYNWLTDGTPKDRPDVCPERNEKVYFDAVFMRCLVDFGIWRRNNRNSQGSANPQDDGWHVLSPLIPDRIDGGNMPLPSERAFDLADDLNQGLNAR